VNVRDFQPTDEPFLRDIHERVRKKLGLTDPEDFPYPKIDFVIDGLMGGGYRLVPETTLLLDPDSTAHPLVKLKGIALLHQALRDKLTSCGHTEAIASVPPGFEAYRRHLQRHFGWKESWPTFRISDRRTR
jgi:hypothetical protein